MHACFVGRKEYQDNYVEISLKKKKKILLKCSFGPESKATYAESIGFSKLILHTIAFQFCSLFATVSQF